MLVMKDILKTKGKYIYDYSAHICRFKVDLNFNSASNEVFRPNTSARRVLVLKYNKGKPLPNIRVDLCCF